MEGAVVKQPFVVIAPINHPSSALKLDVIEHLHDPVFFPFRSIVADNLLIYLRNNGVPSRKNDDVSCWRHRPPAGAVGGSGWATPPFCDPDNDFSFLVSELQKIHYDFIKVLHSVLWWLNLYDKQLKWTIITHIMFDTLESHYMLFKYNSTLHY